MQAGRSRLFRASRSYAEWRCGAVRCPVRPLNPSTRGAPDGLRNRRPRHETAVIIRTWRDSRFRQYRYIDCCRLRSEEHTSELQSLMRISYAVFCLKKKNIKTNNHTLQYNDENKKTNRE